MRDAFLWRKTKSAFFPGYLFIQTNLQKVSLSRINTCHGVLHLVAFGKEQQPVRPGDLVRIKYEGPLQDLEMVFVGSSAPDRRFSVLLNIWAVCKKCLLTWISWKRFLRFRLIKGKDLHGGKEEESKAQRAFKKWLLLFYEGACPGNE